MSFLITSVLNCASDRLAISLSLNFLFFWSFDLFFHLGHFFFVLAHLLGSKGWSLRCSPGQGNPLFCVKQLHCGIVCGVGVREGTMPPAPLSCGLSVTFSVTHKQNGPFWCWFPGRWFCVCSRTLWVSPVDSLVRLGVSPTAATITGFFSQRFWGFISLQWNPGLPCLSCSLVVLPRLSACKCGTTYSAIHHLTQSTSSHLVLPGPPANAWLWVLSAQLPISTAPTGLDECFVFNSLVVGL